MVKMNGGVGCVVHNVRQITKGDPHMDHLDKKRERAGTYASSLLGSTIGAAGCHGRVRDGNGWSPGA